jgi:hypothetical protein
MISSGSIEYSRLRTRPAPQRSPTWAAGSDRDRRRDRFEQRDLRLDAAAVHQDGFDRFRNAVSANALRSVARHEADDQRAGDRHQHHKRPQMMTGGRDERRIDALKEETEKRDGTN